MHARGHGQEGLYGHQPLVPFTRAELFKELKTYEDVVRECARVGRFGPPGCVQAALSGDEVCKPAVASILATLSNEEPVAVSIREIQDTSVYVLANMQRSGQYSVIPRVAGAEITPQEMILLGTVGLKFNLWGKVPAPSASAWSVRTCGSCRKSGRTSPIAGPPTRTRQVKVRVQTQGMESGQACGKALCAVKSCVGTSCAASASRSRGHGG